jgi:hypothetical protein
LQLQKEQIGDPQNSANCKTEREMMAMNQKSNSTTRTTSSRTDSISTNFVFRSNSMTKPSRIFGSQITATATIPRRNGINTGNIIPPWGEYDSGVKLNHDYSVILFAFTVINLI